MPETPGLFPDKTIDVMRQILSMAAYHNLMQPHVAGVVPQMLFSAV